MAAKNKEKHLDTHDTCMEHTFKCCTPEPLGLVPLLYFDFNFNLQNQNGMFPFFFIFAHIFHFGQNLIVPNLELKYFSNHSDKIHVND